MQWARSMFLDVIVPLLFLILFEIRCTQSCFVFAEKRLWLKLRMYNSSFCRRGMQSLPLPFSLFFCQLPQYSAFTVNAKQKLDNLEHCISPTAVSVISSLSVHESSMNSCKIR